MIDDKRLQQRMQRIADLVGRLDLEEDAKAARAQSKELLESVMDLHGEAMDRVLQRLRSAGAAGAELIESLSIDPVVSNVLLLYGLHPVDFETRVGKAVEKLRAALRRYAANIDLLGAEGGAVRIQISGVDNSYTADVVRSAVEDELYGAVPDATSVALVGLERFTSPDFVPLEMVGLATAGKTGD